MFGYALVGALAIGAGVGLPLQAAVNVRLRQIVGHPLRASFISFCVGTVLLFVCSVAVRAPWPAA
ncbi:MAG: DMT family transporter, partial [Candidatus Eremiobacteraeota bacterium]|nr:DMT family transporter [Candidatus Eremiobacteraeota bacterium]